MSANWSNALPSIARVGRTSMTVAVDLIHEDVLSGRRRSAVRGTFEMVAVDANGRPVPIHAIPP